MTLEIPVVDYDSAARQPAVLAELTELFRYRDLLQMMVANIIKTRYKRSVLGVVWTLLNPLLNMAVLTLAFSSIFSSTLAHYPVYVLTGLIFWNFFAQSTLFAMNTLVWGGGLLKRVYIPHTIFAVASVGNGLVNLGLSLIPLVLIMLLLGHPFYATWWLAPLAILLGAMFTLGVALFLSSLAVFYTDVVDLYQVLVQAMFFLTPIMYPKSIFPTQFMWLLNLNPMYNLLELFRVPIYAGAIPGSNTILAAVFAAVAALALGWWTFTRKADEFAYRL
jgi:ABC-type polysaccharide/polyol phosphate export permease